jgi:hypothetical protein
MGNSNEVQLGRERLGHWLILQDFSIELRALLGVLEDGGDLDRASPVDIVEALGKGKLLEHALLEGRVGVDHSVVVGNRCASVRLLAHDVEVVVG